MSSHTSGRVYDESRKGLVAMGTTGFAGVMLVTVAVFQILQAIAALADDTVYVSGINYTYELDVTTWGWILLVLGVIGLAVGLGVLASQSWALMAGIVIAAIGAVANFAFMPYYPFWSIATVAFNVFVIWALSYQLGTATD